MSNRPIKFRVWDGERMLSPEEAKGYRLAPDGTLWHWGPVATPVPASHSIALQFTGLTDTEGREVYEGDILEYIFGPVKGRGVVKWVEHGFWLHGANGQNHMPVKHLRRVVGNIYETPDLLNA